MSLGIVQTFVWAGLVVMRLGTNICVVRSSCNEPWYSTNICVGRSSCNEAWYSTNICVGRSSCNEAWYKPFIILISFDKV